ncbi:FCD domain-containing protein [Microbacterium sp. NPDC076911]|uniref:GntR family transcriptional regulator n=1 Tax=Microbacterium sp. NPDC076911 TaxID=3154958 RepID=UPI003432CE91
MTDVAPPVSRPKVVRHQLERLIITGELAPGDRLAEVLLAERLGVSRGPIREAITALERDGLVVQIPNRGAFVRVVSEADARHLYEIRSALFGLACGLSASRHTGSVDIELRGLLSSMRGAAERADHEMYFDLNRAFHRTLLETSGNPFLAKQYETISRSINLFRARALTIPENVAASLEEHERIAAAVTSGDEERARSLGASHIAGGFARHLGESVVAS